MNGVVRRALPGALAILSAALLLAAEPNPAHGETPRVGDVIFLLGDKKYPEALEQAQALMVAEPANADGYYYFCILLKKMDRLASGERYFLEKLERDPDNPFWMFALACIYQHQTDYSRALRFLESAIARDSQQELFYDLYLYVVDVLGEESRGLAFLEDLHRGDPANFFLSSSIAELYLYRNDYPNFLRWEKLATKQNPQFVSTALLNVHRLVYEGRYDEAIATARDWVRRSAERGQLRDETYFQTQLANLLIGTNEYEQALDSINRAFNLTQIIGDEGLERNAEELYATYYSLLGDSGRALEHYRNVLAYAGKARHVKMEAEVLLSMGLLHEVGGDYQSASDAYNRALILAVKVQQLYLQAMALKNLADLKLKLNELDESESYYQQALRLALRMNDPYSRCLLYNSLGALQDSRKEYGQAMANYQQALQLADALNFPPQKGVILLNMTWTLYNQGRKAEVWGKLEEARAICETSRDEALIGETDYLEGVILYKEKRYADAMPFFDRARAAAVRRNAKPQVIYALTGIAACHRKMGRLDAAAGLYRQALAMLEAMQSAMQNIQEQVRFGEDLFNYYEALISIYHEYYQRDQDPRWVERMFDLSERAKARNISTAIARSRLIQKIADISPALNMQLLLINKRLELKQQAFAHRLQADGTAAPEVELTAEIKLLEKQRTAFVEQIGRENPRFYQLLSPGVRQIGDLRRELPEDTALVEFFVGEKETFYWVVRRRGVVSGTLGLTRERLHQLLRDVSYTLYSPKKVDFSGDYLKNDRWAGIRTRALRRLYQSLAAPLEEPLRGCSRLVVIPDDKLHYLPFEMLVDRIEPDGSVRFLLERIEISYLPFAGMRSLRPRTEEKAVDLRNVLLLGDPRFAGQKGAPTNGRPVPITNLPYSGDEVRQIHSLIPQCRLFLGEEATETHFKQLAPKFRVLHPSTHNLIDDRQPFYSRLVFAPDPAHGEDGSLFTYEIFNMSLNADLVVLSGCETGLGLLSRGEGIVGLSRAFIYAGSSSLVVSLWPVGDQSTSGLMAAFYQDLWQGRSKGDSLRRAKQRMIRDPLKRDPFFWAPFILLGDADPLPFSRKPWYAPGWLWLAAGLVVTALGLMLWGRRRLRH